MHIRPSMLYVLAATVLLALVNTGSMYELNASEWASWVQAVGSIAAIAGAFMISHGQHLKERRSEQERRDADERQRFKIVLAILTKVQVTNNGVEAAGNVDPYCQTRPDIRAYFSDLQKVLDSLAPFDMPHEDLVLICHGLYQQLSVLLVALNDAHVGGQPVAPRLLAEIREAYKEIDGFVDLGTQLCQREIDLRKGR